MAEGKGGCLWLQIFLAERSEANRQNIWETIVCLARLESPPGSSRHMQMETTYRLKKIVG